MRDDEYGDFELYLEFQLFRKVEGNSGIQFRSRYDPYDTLSGGKGWLNGPQSDIHPLNPLRAGLIYDETRGVQRWIYPSLPDWKISTDQAPESALKTEFVYADEEPDAWNNMEIICRGMHIRTFVNQNPVTDFHAEGILDDEIHRKLNVGSSGHIALQLHANDALRIRFRNLYIREL
jgi:hypothetical protein